MSTRTGTGTPEPPPADPDELVDALNALLAALSLERIRLESVQDLTPSLLLAVLESMLRARLPVPPETRAARTRAARVDAMKVFLGVLETDVLREDVGLADVDPRRLADGEWDECVFVAELLVWLARDMAYLPAEGDDNAGAESSGMAAARSAVAIQEPERSTATARRPAMHAHKESVTSMRTADSNPFIVRPRPRVPQPTEASTSYSARRSYSPPSPIPSSHPSRTPSPPNVTHTASSLGLSFRPPRASSPARLPEEDDEEDGEHTQLCRCDPDASSASSATFCTCSHDDDHPPPPDSPPIRRRGSTPSADIYTRRRSLEPSAVPSSSRRPSFDPSTSTSRRISQPPSSRRASAEPSSSGRAPVRYDGWIARVEGDVEAFEAAHPPRARARPSRSASALESRYPLGSPYAPSARGRNPTRHVSPAQHTLALMAERARLLGELASIRAGPAGRTR